MSSCFSTEVSNFDGLNTKPTDIEQLLEQAGLRECGTILFFKYK